MVGLRRSLALVALVVVLGLLQGTRTALGPAPLVGASEAPAAAGRPVPESAGRAGRFFRPPGSDAVPPPLALRPMPWRPERALPVARACSARADGSC